MSKDFENNDYQGPNNFGLPEGYFENSAGSILNKIECIEELKEFKNLSLLKKENNFVVPENYFANSDVRFELFDYPKLLRLKKVNPFIVPENYFESNATKLNTSDSENELFGFEKLSLIEKQNSFTVSENYFVKSEQKITSALIKEAKLIRLFSTKAWYSAAAAVLTITLGLWIYTQYFKVADNDCTTLACITKAELMKTKNLENIDNDDLFELVDTKKLENNLDGSSDNKESKKKSDSLKDVSVDDLPDGI